MAIRISCNIMYYLSDNKKACGLEASVLDLRPPLNGKGN
jgi:hypothetical protein